jgi:hypothetical protein
MAWIVIDVISNSLATALNRLANLFSELREKKQVLARARCREKRREFVVS